MKNAKHIIAILAIWLPLLISGNRELIAQVQTGNLNSTDIDFCGNDDAKRCEIWFSAGILKKADSLSDFTFDIRYDRSKFYFVSFLPSDQTIAGLFEYKDGKVLDTNIIRVFAGGIYPIMTPDTSNPLPLFAFSGKYIGECPDTTSLVVDYIEMTASDEFRSRLKIDSSLIIDGRVKDKPTREVKITSANDSIIFKSKDKTEETVLLKLNTNSLFGVKNITYSLNVTNPKQFEILEIKSVSDSVQIDDTIKTEKGYVVKTTIDNDINDKEVLSVRVRNLSNVSDTGRIEINITDINSCSCASRYKGTRANLKSIKDDAISVNKESILGKELKAYYNSYKEMIVVESSEYNIESIRLFNIDGSLVSNYISDSPIMERKILKNGLANGYYIANIRLSNNKENNIVLIIY